MKKALLVTLALALTSLGLVACGGGDDTSDAGGAGTQAESTTGSGGGASGGEAEGGTAGSGSVVDLEAVPGTDLAYTTDEATATGNPVTINFTNPQAIGHDVVLEDSAGETIAQTDVITEDSQSVKGSFPPGTYTFYCSVPGHREAGMEGTLTVE